MEAQEVSERVRVLVYLGRRSESFRLGIFLLNLLHQEGRLELGHVSHDLLLQTLLSALVLAGKLFTNLCLAHPRVVADLFYRRSLLVVVSHHVEDQVFEFLRIGVFLLLKLNFFCLEKIVFLAKSDDVPDQVNEEVDEQHH